MPLLFSDNNELKCSKCGIITFIETKLVHYSKESGRIKDVVKKDTKKRLECSNCKTILDEKYLDKYFKGTEEVK